MYSAECRQRYDETEVVTVKTRRNTIATGVIVVMAVLSLAAPAVAAPGPGGQPITRAATASGGTAATRQENLRNRVTNVLRARKARFDAVAANLVKRQARVAALADQVAALGGDVSKVSTLLAASEQARAQEQVCVDAFKAVPDATDKMVAFRAARAEGRSAVELLKNARIKLRDAARELRTVAEQVREGDES